MGDCAKKALSAALHGLKAQQVRRPGWRPGFHAPPFPTPCRGKSKNQSFAHTFALTGRRCLCIDTQGASLGSGLTALSGRSFSRFVRLSCAHASPPYYLAQKKAQWLQILALVHPFSRRGIARHAPVASRTQAAAPHFGTVGEATALKLLREETPKKCFEPMFYDIV